MKKTILFYCIYLMSSSLVKAQNVGIKTTTPQTALDINGDLALRKGTLTLAAGPHNNLDISTSKYSVYDFAGGALSGGVQIYGFAGGTDGRIITIFNNSTTSGVQIADESHPGSISSLAANRIITGSGNSAIIYQSGSVTLRYDGQKQRWTIIGSNYTDGLSAAPAAWLVGGNTGTNPATNFIGTTDNQPLSFKINNSKAGFLSSLNVALGMGALNSNTTGYYNTANGTGALYYNTTGLFNTANGASAMYSNTTGYNNTANGTSTLYSNTTGYNNTANGIYSLYSNTTGDYNTANGANALYANTTGYYNAANGIYSLYANTYGDHNTANGANALNANTIGHYNTANGYNSLGNNITGSNNISIGADAGTTGSFNNTVSIGNNGYLNAYHNQVILGNLNTVWIGGHVNWATFSDRRIKKNIKENVIGLAFINRLRPVTYNRDIEIATTLTGNKPIADYPQKYDAEKIKTSGFIAQEVEQAAMAAGYDFDGVQKPKNDQSLYTLTYASFVVPLVKAVQEQQKMIEQQMLLIQQLQKEIVELQKRKN